MLSASAEREITRSVISAFSSDGNLSYSAIFILGAPRTGSTLFYQLLVRQFGLPYLSNLVNDQFPYCPAIGLLVEGRKGWAREISVESRFGKTCGCEQPSEGSAVMARWFGGEHPSELRSAEFLPGQEPLFVDAIGAVNAAERLPLVIKNAWNCFRIKALVRALPSAGFIWIRRNICDAALSDLNSRYRDGDPAQVWNSATPANVKAIQQLPYWEQVVEQQYAYNRRIEKDLGLFAIGRWRSVCYENLLHQPESVLDGLGRFFGLAKCRENTAKLSELVPKKDWPLLREGDHEKVRLYVDSTCSSDEVGSRP